MSDVGVQIVNAVKRPRKPNFSTAECATILEMAEENIDIVREKFSNVVTNQKKAEVWRVSKVNAHGVTVRAVSEVKDKWRAMVVGPRKISREKNEKGERQEEERSLQQHHRDPKRSSKCSGMNHHSQAFPVELSQVLHAVISVVCHHFYAHRIF